ncbi:MAG TPA: undecaprenyl-diphosphate phosphatase [Mycobacteriales bacterium]|nr:undecaprenyl-diphosphate phosphatase [Mycobacteriales bacterium]
MPDVSVVDAVILGVVEGITEFLPVSSTGHLTIVTSLLGIPIDDPSVTSFTAVIQVGAIAAVLLFFRTDIAGFVRGFAGGVGSAEGRQSQDFRMALAVLVGSLPIGLVGLLFRDVVKGPVLRSLVTVGLALILWSAVMWFAEKRATRDRGEADITVRDGLLIGVVQCIALVPGVSRSGATISAGLLLGLDRVAATRMSFFLSIPALTAAGVTELPEALGGGVGAVPTAVGTVVSFFVAYASIAWLLRFVATHSIAAFVPYRVALGTAVLIGVAVTA